MRAVDQTGGMPFESPYAHGFVRVAAAVPRVRVGDPRFNGARTLEHQLISDRKTHGAGAKYGDTL